MNVKRNTYFDWASTSFPKPEAVGKAVLDFSREIGIGNDRGVGEETIKVADLFRRARVLIGMFLKAPPRNIVFTSGSTESLNTLMLGFLKGGDHVLITPFEHNSVMQPLSHLARTRGVQYSMIPATLEKGLDLDAVPRLIRPETRLVLVNHISNVFGLITPLSQLVERIPSRRNIFLAVDAAQSLGVLDIDVTKLGLDFVAFSGHKGLLGPTGTGGFFISERLFSQVQPLKFGGTDFRAEEEIFIPELPYKFESGTQNTWGIAGLVAGMEALRERDLPTVSRLIQRLTQTLIRNLSGIPGITLLTPPEKLHLAIVSLQVNGMSPIGAAEFLCQNIGLKLRGGMHCAPAAHRMAGTFPGGTLRAGIGALSTMIDIEWLIHGLRECVKEASIK